MQRNNSLESSNVANLGLNENLEEAKCKSKRKKGKNDITKDRSSILLRAKKKPKTR
jgi:hypothetical protein